MLMDHLGHLAGVYISADICTFFKIKWRRCSLYCGSDEHGAAITLRAKKEGKTPKEIVDVYHQSNKEVFEQLGISFDYYDRTSAEHHLKTAQELFLELEEKGAFIKKESEQYFDKEFNQFLADRYITGTCPKCGAEEAYGDQCEQSALSPTNLLILYPL